VASQALLEAASSFEGSASAALGAELRRDAAATREATAAYLQRRTRLGETVGDLRAMTWRSRARLLRELAFPPAGYMRDVYAAGRGGPLPFLYARRLMTGLARWGRRRR
jgi:hypothetical protein